MDAETPPPPSRPPPSVGTTQSVRPRVLIVDDTPANLTLLSEMLIARGYDVSVATNGRRALALAAAQPPSAIMLDISMPDMNGYEVCGALKAKDATRAVPVLFLSSLDEVGDKVAAFRAGGVDYVTKPFAVEEVMARLETQLRIARLTGELEARRRDLERQNAELARRNDELMLAHRRTDRVFLALAELLPGKVLDEKYLLEEKIGAGGFGTVFRGKHLLLDRAVAVKVFRPTPANDTTEGLERFRAEGAAACRVDHPNVVQVLDSGIAESIPYLVMELLEGRPLSEAIAEEKPMPPARVAGILVPVCRALAEAAAQSVVHRDIKPSNVFLHRGRDGEIVKVVDFGIAKLLGAPADPPTEDATMTGVLIGSPAYMAPERILGAAYDARSDIYSVGVMAYEMLAGRRPFEARGAGHAPIALRSLIDDPPLLRELAPEVPAELDAIVMAAMARRPESRPSARDLAASLAPFAQGRSHV